MESFYAFMAENSFFNILLRVIFGGILKHFGMPYICNDIRYFETNIWTSFETTLWSAFEKVAFQSKLLLNNIVNVISRRF